MPIASEESGVIFLFARASKALGAQHVAQGSGAQPSLLVIIMGNKNKSM